MTWQGWVSLLVFIVVIVVAAFVILPPQFYEPTLAQNLMFLSVVLWDVAALLLVTTAKGPSPRWRWGKKSDDNPDQDF